MSELDKNVYYTYDYDSIQIEPMEENHQEEIIKVNNREYEIIGAETVQDLRVKDMLSSTRGYTTFDPKGKIHSFQ